MKDNQTITCPICGEEQYMAAYDQHYQFCYNYKEQKMQNERNYEQQKLQIKQTLLNSLYEN